MTETLPVHQMRLSTQNICLGYALFWACSWFWQRLHFGVWELSCSLHIQTNTKKPRQNYKMEMQKWTKLRNSTFCKKSGFRSGWYQIEVFMWFSLFPDLPTLFSELHSQLPWNSANWQISIGWSLFICPWRPCNGKVWVICLWHSWDLDLHVLILKKDAHSVNGYHKNIHKVLSGMKILLFIKCEFGQKKDR